VEIILLSLYIFCLQVLSIILLGHQKEHLACKQLSDEVLVWLYVRSEVWMPCVWSSWCHCDPIISCFLKIQNGLTFVVLAYQGCPGKEAVKRVSVCLSLCIFVFDDWSVGFVTDKTGCTIPKSSVWGDLFWTGETGPVYKKNVRRWCFMNYRNCC